MHEFILAARLAIFYVLKMPDMDCGLRLRVVKRMNYRIVIRNWKFEVAARQNSIMDLTRDWKISRAR